MINIYKASAGSGKTFTLAREYIKLILGHKAEDGRYVLNPPGAASGHRRVLAMTFTNKATEEMKSRIIHELAVLAGCERDWDKGSPYEKDLCEIFACTPERLGQAAGDALRGLLYDFSRFSVSTIDSFFQTVLRSFAHEADVSSNYAIELDDQAVITMSVDQLLQSINHSKPTRESRQLEAWITGYMKSLIEEGNQFTLFNKGGNVQSSLIRFIAQIHNDTFKDNEKRIMDYLRDGDRFASFRNIVFDTLRGDNGQSVMRSMAESALNAIMSLPDSDATVQSLLVKFIKGFVEKGWRGYLSKPVPTTVAKVADSSSAMWKTPAIKKGLTDLAVEAIVHDAAVTFVAEHERLSILYIIKDNLYQLGLLSAIMELMERFRVENSTLLLSDTNSLLAKIIGNDDSPFLYEKLGVRYNHYLIDEFQDTSLSQWANMSPLLRESLSYDHDNLVIGDEKQCIYRFRNSDPTLLHNLHRQSWAEGRCEVKGNTVKENTNWRSSADVVNFNNALFTSIARKWGLGEVYSNVVQQVSPKHSAHRGYVKVRFFDATADPEAETLAQLATEMRRQLESGYKPGDIAVLVRRASEGERVINYLEALREEDPDFPKFDIISDKSLLISHSDAVSSIISRLRLMASIDIPQGRHMRSNREIARVMDDYERAYASGLAPEQSLALALDNLSLRGADGVTTQLGMNAGGEPAPASLETVDLLSLVENIISIHLDAELRERDNVYITAFVDAVVNYMGQGHGDVRSFLQWWDETGCSLSIAGGSDSRALNILTMHKSKGLEFPCVHVPFGECSGSNKADVAWFELPEIEGVDPNLIPPMMPLKVTGALSSTALSEQYEEIKRERVLDRTNLLYVALTRAVDELIIGVKVTKKDRETGPGKDEIPSVAHTIFDAMSSGLSPDGQTPLWVDENMCFTLGSPTTRLEEKAEKATAMHPEASVRVSGYELADTRPVWGNTKVDLDRLNRVGVARERGLILHELMANVRSREDVERAFSLFAASGTAAAMSSGELQDLREIVDERVSDKRARGWFDGFRKVYIEHELVTKSGQLRRVDRVVWTAEGELHVIDYKSGTQEPRRYMRQVREYMDFFRSIGYPHVQGFLYYLDTGQIVEVE